MGEFLAENIQMIFSLLPGHVYWLDAKNCYQGCNRLYAKFVGLSSSQEITGKTNKELPVFSGHEKIIDSINSNNLEVINSGSLLIRNEEFIQPDGTLILLSSIKIPLRDPEGKTVGIFALSLGPDELENGHNAVLVQKNFAEFALSGIIENLPEHVYWKDRDGKYLGCNQSQVDDLGFKNASDVVGKTDYDLSPPDKADAFRRVDMAVLNSGQPVEAEEEIIKNGKRAIVLSKKIPLKNLNKEIVGVIGVSVDITELKEAQEREKKAIAEAADEAATKRAIMVFSGMIAHDLRTPLATASMGGFALKKNIPALVEAYQKASEAELEVPSILPSVLRDLEPIAVNIMDSIREANAYIDASLKSLKAASQGGDLLSKEQLVLCDAERLLRRSVKDYPYKLGDEAKVHLNTEVTFGFMGNEIFVSRLFENLMKNAFEQIQLKGKGEIFIQTELNDTFNHINIKDTAGGVTQSIIDQVNQAEMKSTKEGGTGVGLSSAKHTMDALGGSIKARLVDTDCIEFVLSFPKMEQ